MKASLVGFCVTAVLAIVVFFCLAVAGGPWDIGAVQGAYHVWTAVLAFVATSFLVHVVYAFILERTKKAPRVLGACVGIAVSSRSWPAHA